MIEITVAMPARNAAAFLGQAMASIQHQTEIDWELVVVDDASEGDTANVVRAVQDPRIRLLTNASRRGIGYCHNRVVAASAAPFIAHVDADDFILPGALRKMVQALENKPRAGQAHCQFYDIDEEGKVQRDLFMQRVRMYQRRAQNTDYRRDLIAVGNVSSGLRTFPRRVLDVVGGFNETLTFGVDYDMALRIVDQYEIAFVPEFLYARRVHAHNTTESLPLKRWRFFWQRYQICRALARSQQVMYFQQAPYSLNRLWLTSVVDTLGITRAQAFVREKILSLSYRARVGLDQRIVTPVVNGLYEFAVNHGAGWRLHWRTHPPIARAPQRIGYYLWRFPTLSETFVRREVQALRDAGIPVVTFADEPGGLADETSVNPTRYLLPRDEKRTARAIEFFKQRGRLRFWNSRLFTVLHRYGAYKTRHEDEYVFERAVALAYQLHEHSITHIHAPWADRTAFIGLVAAALLNIPFSVETRAHDLYRRNSQYGLSEKFSNAQFVITNSNYNARAIATYLNSPQPPPVHVIREPFPLQQFHPPARRLVSEPFRILCVARLIEEKGLVYLLHACSQLRARGLTFRCEIIGAPEEPTYTTYLIQLKRLYQHLRLHNWVAFLGAQPYDRVLDAYSRAHLFVLPCVIAENGGRDISPNALIEAMAMGLPVISTQVAAIPEIVEQGVSGILVPPNDAEALANAIIELMQDEPRRCQSGARARERVHAQYAAEQIVPQYLSLFQSAAQRNRAAQ